MDSGRVFVESLIAYKSEARYIINKGATRSGKTYSILSLLVLIAIESPKPLLISIVSETMPHLKKGCIRDFVGILKAHGLYDERNINRTDNIFTLGVSQVEFFSCDSASKVHGPQRDILFINECNNVNFDIFTQLNIRTASKVFLDYNPVTKFWVDRTIMEAMPPDDWRLIHSTYKDNKFLTSAQVAAIEARRHDYDWWQVYGLGLTGGRSGLVYPDYNVVPLEQWPTSFAREALGMDFGFVADPTALVWAGMVDGELWVKELIYEQGLTNGDIAERFRDLDLLSLSTVADSAEQKSIEELRRERIRVIGCRKGSGSIAGGISTVKKYRLNVLATSKNIIEELDSYAFLKDKDGNFTNKPKDANNHAMDAMRYVVVDMLDRSAGSGAIKASNTISKQWQ